MKINAINPVNFNGVILFKNNKFKMEETINTDNIISIDRDDDGNTDIIAKNPFDDKDKKPYFIYTFKQPIKDVIMQYNKACRNEFADLGTSLDVVSGTGIRSRI